MEINHVYANGKIVGYLVEGSGIPTMKFETCEETYAIVAIINLLKSQNIEFDLCCIKHIFRLLGVKSVWTE